MPILRHIVIFLYVAELIVFAMLLMGSRRPRTPLRENLLAMLCVAMFVRILVKMVYFYVEYYILPWHLSISFNAIMDITYVASVIIALKLAAERAGVALSLKKPLVGVACAYVIGLAIVSFLWVDPASNHVIVVAEGVPQAAAVAIELVFLGVAIVSGFATLRAAGGNSQEKTPTESVALVATACLYALYIAIWDISLYVTTVVPLSSIKPFDGVLVYGALIAAIVAARYLHAAQEETPESSAPRPVDIATFAAEHGLTARETEVLDLLVQGLNTTQVAEKLVVSTNTARRHTYNIYQKVGVSSRFELLFLVNNPGAPIPSSTSENTNE